MLALIAQMPTAVGAALIVPALAAMQWCVRRRGGWRLIGPHAYYDLIRLSRKGRTIVLRVLFLLALLAGIWHTYQQSRQADFRLGTAMSGPIILQDKVEPNEVVDFAATRAMLREQLARFNVECVYAWFLLQNITILMLTPAYVGGAIAEERERGTLELLLTTGLYNREIALGKWLARLVHLGAFLIAPLPVFSIMLVWGGVDLWLLLGGWISGVLLLLTACSVCLMFSTMPARASTAVLVSYAVVVPSGACCVGISYAALQEFVLSGGVGLLTVLAVVCTSAIGISLAFAVAAVRPPELPPDPVATAAWNPWVGPMSLATDQAEQRLPSVAPIVTRTATELSMEFPGRPKLPPVGDDALLWKERYTGGRSVLLIPGLVVVLLVPVLMVMMVSPMFSVGMLHGLADAWGDGLRACYAIVLVSYGIGVAFRSAGCVVRERQMHTLDMLLQLPIERGEILRAKWRGALQGLAVAGAAPRRSRHRAADWRVSSGELFVHAALSAAVDLRGVQRGVVDFHDRAHDGAGEPRDRLYAVGAGRLRRQHLARVVRRIQRVYVYVVAGAADRVGRSVCGRRHRDGADCARRSRHGCSPVGASSNWGGAELCTWGRHSCLPCRWQARMPAPRYPSHGMKRYGGLAESSRDPPRPATRRVVGLHIARDRRWAAGARGDRGDAGGTDGRGGGAGLAVLQWFVWRRGGWRLIGPHSYYDLVRTAQGADDAAARAVPDRAVGSRLVHLRPIPGRRGRSTAAGSGEMRETLARFNTQCVFAWLVLQHIAILVLAPAFVGGAIAEERERGTLDLLLATKLYSREIALGKLFAQLVHLGTFLIAGLPVFSIMLVWGGVDLRLLLAGWLNSVLLLVAVSAACLLFSTMPVRASTTVIVSYAIVAPMAGCCSWVWSYTAIQIALLSAPGGGSIGPLLGLAIGYACW